MREMRIGTLLHRPFPWWVWWALERRGEGCLDPESEGSTKIHFNYYSKMTYFVLCFDSYIYMALAKYKSHLPNIPGVRNTHTRTRTSIPSICFQLICFQMKGKETCDLVSILPHSDCENVPLLPLFPKKWTD